jgi:enediyne biosynthesis protein E4
VQGDDSVIGRAVLRSALAIVLVGIVGGGVWWFRSMGSGRKQVRVTQLAAPQAATNSAAAEVPKAVFTDVTAAAGIQFRHETGAAGEKLLPETMGGGVGLGDLDGDGDPDLIFVNGSHWPWAQPAGATTVPPGLVLYRNDSTPAAVKFVDVTSDSGLSTPFYGMGVAIGDADGDGQPDLFVTGVGGARLFRNRGGLKFEDVTAAAGVAGDPADWTSAALWLDHDRDGDLDLFVASYVRWSRAVDAEVGYKIDGQTRAYGPPMNFQGALPRFYRNDGNGKFTDISETAGVQVKNPSTGVPAAKTLGLALVDINHDGWPDVVAANDTVQNFVFVNRRNGTFQEAGAETGIAFDSYGNPRGAMGIDAGCFTPDGKLGVAIGNFANEMTAMYVEAATSTPESPHFSDESISWGVGGPSRDPLKFGVFFFDYDLDGRLDLLTVNGHLEEEIAKIQHGQKYRQSAQLFWNAGDAGFVVVGADAAGKDLFQAIVGRGSAFADIDGDGDLDVVLTQLGGAPILLRNDQQLGHGWVRVRLVGKAGNPEALGASVRLKAGGRNQWRTQTTTRSYLSSSEAVLTFGLGSAREVEELEVVWPDGSRQTVTGATPGKVITVKQP